MWTISVGADVHDLDTSCEVASQSLPW